MIRTKITGPKWTNLCTNGSEKLIRNLCAKRVVSYIYCEIKYIFDALLQI